MFAYLTCHKTHSGFQSVDGSPQYKRMVSCSWRCNAGLSTLTQGCWPKTFFFFFKLSSVASLCYFDVLYQFVYDLAVQDSVHTSVGLFLSLIQAALFWV